MGIIGLVVVCGCLAPRTPPDVRPGAAPSARAMLQQLAKKLEQRDLPEVALMFTPQCRYHCRGFVPLVRSKGGGYQAASWVPRVPGDDGPLVVDLARILISYRPGLRVRIVPLRMRVFDGQVLMRARLRVEGTDAEGYRRVDEGLVDLDLRRGPLSVWKVHRLTPVGVNTLRVDSDTTYSQRSLDSRLAGLSPRRQSLALPGAHSATPWVVFDADSDGVIDLATVRRGEVVVLKGARGGFGPPRRLFRQPRVRCLRGVDINGDGRTDLFAGSYGAPSRLWLQQPNGGFAAGLSVDGHVTDAVAADYDGDGFVDLYVVRHGPPEGWPEAAGERDLLLHGGEQVKVSAVGRPGWGVAACAGDLNHDGAPDIFVATVSEGSRLLINNGGRFVDRGRELGMRTLATSCALGDVNNDGRLDLLVGGRRARNAYLFGRPGVGAPGDGIPLLDRQRGRSRLRRMGDAIWINRTRRSDAVSFVRRHLRDIGWTRWTGVVDHDCDGRSDLLLLRHQPRQADVEDRFWWDVVGPALRGRKPKLPLWGTLTPAPGRLWVNLGPDGSRCCQWVDGGVVAGLPPAITALSHDMDGDGAPDLLLDGGGAPLVFSWRGEREMGHAALLSLEGRRPNPNAVGARVTLWAEGRRQVREVGSASGLPGGPPGFVHFGVGGALRVEKVVVRWPDRTTQRFVDLPVDQPVRLAQGGHASWGAQPAPDDVDDGDGETAPPASQPQPGPSTNPVLPARLLELSAVGDAGPGPLRRLAGERGTVLLFVGGTGEAACRRVAQAVRGLGPGVKAVAVAMDGKPTGCSLPMVVATAATVESLRSVAGLLPLVAVVNPQGRTTQLVSGSLDRERLRAILRSGLGK